MLAKVLFFFITFVFRLVTANVEKTIFIAPDPLTVPQDASIDNLLLASLNPEHLIFRTYVNATFPTEDNPRGQDTWALLEGLSPGQRYEFRVCWLATQPTTFWIYTHSLNSVFESADLITSLSIYSHARHSQLRASDVDELQERRFASLNGKENSMLFLQIQAAADYFTMNKTLMQQVPLVHVDLILDPYLLNIFPQSLVPTGIYISIIAIFAWFFSAWAYRQIQLYVIRNTKDAIHEKDKKIN